MRALPAGVADPRAAARASSQPAAIAALIVVACALLLPFAPVEVNEPTASWPVDPARPESTRLALTAYRPLALDARFSCDVLRLAGATTEGIVLATTLPEWPGTATTGLLVRASAGRVQVQAMGRMLLDEPVPQGPCLYRMAGRSAGLPSYVPPQVLVGSTPVPGITPPTPDLRWIAGPNSAQLVVSRDGTELARGDGEQLPDVDALITSVPALPTGVAGGLAVSLRLDDEFTSSPSPVKSALTLVLCSALLATVALLVRARAPAAAGGRRSRRQRLPPASGRLPWTGERQRAAVHLVGPVSDLVVAATLVAWTFLAPTTDDDGYFSAQSVNAALNGEVGNYYMHYDQSFVPFTWLYQGLSWWQQLAGMAPVTQRLPALLCGLLGWLAIRRCLAGLPSRQVSAPAGLAVAYLAWWLPYGMGVRPEPAVALFGVAVLLAVLRASQRRSPALAWTAFALAGAGFTAHPTGFSVIAVLVAGTPLLLPVVWCRGQLLDSARRAFAVASGAMVAPLLGFADGALRDFRRGQALVAAVLVQDGWSDELTRYEFLLSDLHSSGNFAKRAAVLAGLVALVWFVVLAVAARVRRVPLPVPLWLAGSATALSLGSFAFTPSKWTHHFGALAGLGGLFLGLMLTFGVSLTRRLLLPPSRLVPVWVSTAVALLLMAVPFAAVIARAWRGPNAWSHAWMEGVASPDLPPTPGGFRLDRPVGWALAIGVVALLLLLAGRLRVARRPDVLWAVPVVIVISLVGSICYPLAAFGGAAARDMPSSSIWARTVANPSGSGCGPAGVVRVLDHGSARPLPEAPQARTAATAGRLPGTIATGSGFVADGYYAGSPPPGVESLSGRIWGSLAAPDGGDLEANTGDLRTGWYALPGPLPDDSRVTVLVAGLAGAPNLLTAEYADAAGQPLRGDPLDDLAPTPYWRTLVLNPPEGAAVVRLAAQDQSAGVHGWLAVTAPSVSRTVLLRHLLPAAAPVAMGWQLSFEYPCQRHPAIVDGITEPPAYAILWDEPGMNEPRGLGWASSRGGAFGQVPRSHAVLRLATVEPVDPHIQVYAFTTPLAANAYTLTRRRRTVGGADVNLTGAGFAHIAAAAP